MCAANRYISSITPAQPHLRAITQISAPRNPSPRCNPRNCWVNSIRMTAVQAKYQLDQPGVADGAAIWRIARDSKVLDLNSSYSYLLWCRDFAATSAVARDENGEVA